MVSQSKLTFFFVCPSMTLWLQSHHLPVPQKLIETSLESKLSISQPRDQPFGIFQLRFSICFLPFTMAWETTRTKPIWSNTSRLTARDSGRNRTLKCTCVFLHVSVIPKLNRSGLDPVIKQFYRMLDAASSCLLFITPRNQLQIL